MSEMSLPGNVGGADPVELSLIGPLLINFQIEERGLKIDEILQLGFKADYFIDRACRTVWMKYIEWHQAGNFTHEKLVSFCNNCMELADDKVDRYLWVVNAAKFGNLLFMVTNALELIERRIRQDTLSLLNSVPKGRANEMLSDLEAKILILKTQAAIVQTDEKLEACKDLTEELEAMDRGERRMIKSGVQIWDSTIGGLPKHKVISVCARPGRGKTSLAEQIIDASVREGRGVLYIQREMERSAAIGRLACRNANVNWWRAENFTLTKDENARLRHEVKIYERLPLYLAPVSICNAASISSMINFHVRHHKIELVVLDYVQQIDVPKGLEQRVAIGQVTAALKRAANQTGVTVLCLAQLGRSSEGEKPTLGSIKESGNIEQDSDVVLALWSEYEPEESRYPVKWTVLKNRNGPKGTIEVTFDGPSMSFLGKDGK